MIHGPQRTLRSVDRHQDLGFLDFAVNNPQGNIGGVLNNLPVDVMRQFNPFGTVIAVDVSAPAGPASYQDYGTGLSGWRALVGKMTGPGEQARVPGIATTMLQSMVAGSNSLMWGRSSKKLCG